MIIGVLLFGIVGWCTWWHMRENRQLTLQWKRELDATSAAFLTRFAWTRSIQLIAALGCCTLIILLYDWQLRDARNQLIQANSAAPKTNSTQAMNGAKTQQRIPINRIPINRNAPSQSALTGQASQLVVPPGSNNAYYPPQGNNVRSTSVQAMNNAKNQTAQPVNSTQMQAMTNAQAQTVDTAQGLPPVSPPTLGNGAVTTNLSPGPGLIPTVTQQAGLPDVRPPSIGTSAAASNVVNTSAPDPAAVSPAALPVTPVANANDTPVAAINTIPVNTAAQPIAAPMGITPGEGTEVMPVTQVPVTPGKAVEDVYNPEEQTSGNQAAMDVLKKRYEDILVTYFFLKQCGMVNPNDYHVITSALSQDMASINAPGRLQNDILNSAQGSYKEIYAHSSCQGPTIGQLYSGYNSYIATIAKQYEPH